MEFLSEGMKRYKEASQLMILFGRNVQNQLQEILTQRGSWGPFKPDETRKKRSTTYWHEYPLLNADIFGSIDKKSCTIRIAVNWYQSESSYPFYMCGLENGADENVLKLFKNHNRKNSDFEIGERVVIYRPDPEDFNLSRDFNILIDEFVLILSKL